MPDETPLEPLSGENAQALHEATRDLSDKQKGMAAAEVARNLPPDQKAAVATEAARNLPPEQQVAVATEAARNLPPEKKAIVVAAAGLGPPPDKFIGPLWLIIVIAFVVLLVGSATGAFVLAILGDDTKTLVPFVTAAVGVLAGLLASPGRRT